MLSIFDAIEYFFSLIFHFRVIHWQFIFKNLSQTFQSQKIRMIQKIHSTKFSIQNSLLNFIFVIDDSRDWKNDDTKLCIILSHAFWKFFDVKKQFFAKRKKRNICCRRDLRNEKNCFVDEIKWAINFIFQNRLKIEKNRINAVWIYEIVWIRKNEIVELEIVEFKIEILLCENCICSFAWHCEIIDNKSIEYFDFNKQR